MPVLVFIAGAFFALLCLLIILIKACIKFLAVPAILLFTLASATVFNRTLPHRTMGMYLLVADDTITGYTSKDNWQPQLPEYLKSGSNVVFFAFINPETMAVPQSFSNFARTRGSSNPGAIPQNTGIIFSVGGYTYSTHPNPWPFLASTQAATAMAQEVASWPSKYGCDGIDLDIESGAGDATNVGPNLMTFIKVLKSLNPSMIVTQPVFGYPQVAAESYVVNHSWDVNGRSLSMADAVGIMVYQGTDALMYVKNYAEGSKQWQGFPITVDVTTTGILCGMGGGASGGEVDTMAAAIKSQNLGGIMVWYASVLDGKTGKIAYQYSGGSGDSTPAGSGQWAKAIGEMQ